MVDFSCGSFVAAASAPIHIVVNLLFIDRNLPLCAAAIVVVNAITLHLLLLLWLLLLLLLSYNVLWFDAATVASSAVVSMDLETCPVAVAAAAADYFTIVNEIAITAAIVFAVASAVAFTVVAAVVIAAAVFRPAFF